MDLDYGVYQNLINQKKHNLLKKAKSYLEKPQLDLIKLALEVASHAHVDQKRKSGEPYITHPLEVATIIADWELDAPTIASSLLHDVIEDSYISKADLTQIFGAEISELVDSVTKLEKINFETEEIAQAEYFRKVVLAMAKDIRVILIKLADRLHNMLTLSSHNAEKRKRIALETMEIYMPIANKIGLHKVHLQLAEESFKHLYPLRYKILQKAIGIVQKKRLPIIEEILRNISGALKSNGINGLFIYRQRTTHNVYRRMLRQHQSFNRIYDIFEIKIIVDNIKDCYLTLGVLHILYQPLPGKFKDYIALPKSNGYQSIHSTLMGPNGIPIQIHIRTKIMDEVAENGIISHWLTHNHRDELLSANQRTKTWIANILDVQSSSFSANEFLENIRRDLSPGDVYVFTPKGKIILLPKESTPIDFAYAIHSDVGNHCYQAKINQRLVKLNSRLENGDIVEIITNKDTEPSDEWLSQARSGRAISKIKQYLKEQKYDENISNGTRLINLSLEAMGSSMLVTEEDLVSVAKEHYQNLTTTEMEHCIGVGTIPALEVSKSLLGYPHKKIVDIKLSNCHSFTVIQDDLCYPLPGGKILTHLNRQGNLVLHTPSCKQNKLLGLENLTFVHIINDIDRTFLARLHILIANIPGTFTRFTATTAEKNINIEQLTQEYYNNEFALIKIIIGIKDLAQVEDLISTLDELDFINKINLV